MNGFKKEGDNWVVRIAHLQPKSLGIQNTKGLKARTCHCQTSVYGRVLRAGFTIWKEVSWGKDVVFTVYFPFFI